MLWEQVQRRCVILTWRQENSMSELCVGRVISLHLWSFDLYFIHHYSGYKVTLHTNTITVNVIFYSLLKVGFVLTFRRRCTRLQSNFCFINYKFSYKIQPVLSEVYKFKKPTQFIKLVFYFTYITILLFNLSPLCCNLFHSKIDLAVVILNVLLLETRFTEFVQFELLNL